MGKKIFSAGFALIIILTCSVNAYALDENSSDGSDTQAAICLEGGQIDTDAYMQDGTLYLPVRAVCQALGYSVQWSDKNNDQVITATKDGKSITLDLTNQSVIDNGHTYYMFMGCYTNACWILHDGAIYLDAELLSQIFNVGIEYDSTNKTVKINCLTENQISITTMKLQSEDENLKIDLQYPQIGGLDNTEIESSINAVFTQAASSAVEEGLQNSYSTMQTKQQYPDFTNKAETDLNYRVTYNQNDLLSIVLYTYQYAGGAHGSTIQTSYIFNLSTGKILALADLMKSKAADVSYINAAIRTEIDKRVASGGLVEFSDSKFETIGDNPDYYLTNDAIVFYFQEYQYFPYAAGIQEFPIKYTELKDILNSNYHLYAEPVVLDKSGSNTLKVGESAFVVLDGNPTTGYTWHCTIGDESIIAKTCENYISDSDLIGAGGKYTFGFKALKPGETTITFKYYRDWEGREATAENTVVYKVTVK